METLVFNGQFFLKRAKVMPYVNIKIVKEGVTSRQKEQLIAGISKLLNDVLNKDPQKTYVVIDEVDTDNWGVGYETATQILGRK